MPAGRKSISSCTVYQAKSTTLLRIMRLFQIIFMPFSSTIIQKKLIYHKKNCCNKALYANKTNQLENTNEFCDTIYNIVFYKKHPAV